MEQDIFSQHSETAILSLILKNPELLDKTIYLTPKMFSSVPNKNVYDAILIIKRDGLVPEFSLLITYLESRGLLQLCGGESYVQWLLNQNFDINNFEEFVKQIIDLYKTRELLTISTQLSGIARSNDSVDEKITWLKNKVSELNLTENNDLTDLFTATRDMLSQLEYRLEHPGTSFIKTGFDDLDLITGGFYPGDLWVIAGRPGMGKSALLCNSILNSPSLVFSLEMPNETIAQRLVGIKSGVPIFNMRIGNVDKDSLVRIKNTVDEIKTLPIYIDTTYDINITKVVSKIQQYHREKGIKVVHIDYIQLLAERSNNAVHDLGQITRELKLLAKELDVTIVTYSQLNRLVESRDDKRPILSDLRQSGNIEEDVDIALFLYRDILYNKETKYPNQMEYIIRKQRNGPIGTVFMNFDDASNRIMGIK